MSRRSERMLAGGALALALSIAAYQLLFYFPRAVDDMFISLRYAERLASGDGLTYNPGERVEGFSSPLWVLLQSLGFVLGAEGVLWTKLLGLASTVLFGIAVAAYATRRLRLGAPYAALTLAALFACSYVTGWALLGLETPLYLALLVAWPPALGRHLEQGTRPSALLAALAGCALAVTRPEAPLFVGLLGGAAVLATPRARWRRALLPAAAVTAVLAALLVSRRAYYGLWLPHTFYAKRGTGFDPTALQSLWAEGARLPEMIVLGLGIAGALWLLVRRRDPVPFVAIAACSVFVAAVERDWMPNQRHLLPVWVFALLSLAALASALPRVAAVLVLAVVSWCGWFQLGIDSRYSPKDFATHGHGENWHRLKSPEAWSDVWYALRRQTPPHVLAMPIDSMGNIDQLFRVLEISRAPLADTWYIGRDIGRVGHYAPELKVFDTDGLFTPAAVGTADHVSADAARRAFRLRPIATDLLDGWQVAVGRIIHELGDYRLAFGSRFRPHVLVRRATPPLPAQVLERYARASERLPRSFFLATLYGESVGAAIERRHDWVRRQLSGRRSFGVAQAPPALPGAGVEFDGVVRLHGCRTTHSQVAPGRAVELACYFEAVGAVARDYRVFVHWTDDSGAHVASSDHRPCGGFLPAPEWSPGTIVEDRFEASFRPELAGKRLRARIGLFEGDHRARARPLASTDGHDRVHGPELVVIR